MKTNADFGKFLFEAKPQTHPVHLTLYNFIRNFSDLNATFSAETIHRFYFKALSYEHWQKNSLELSQEVRLLLEKYLKNEMKEATWKNLKHSDEIQIIRFFHKKDQLEMIHNYFKSKRLNFNFKIYSDKNSTSHAVLAFPHGPIHVYSFDDQAAIIQGQLKPLSLDRKLEYTAQLDLAPNVRQTVYASHFVSAHFQQKKDILSGEYIRGYTLQAYKRFEAYHLNEELQLFYAVKKIERFFIDRATEPLYIELVNILEQTLEFLKKNHPGSVELAQKAYLRGQNALENLFVDDKMIPLLLKDILTLLTEKGILWTPQISSGSINSSHKRDSLAEEPQIN